MSTATIQIVEIQPPGEGKKQATVKAATGERFGVFADKLSGFGLEVGKTAEVEFTSRPYNGKTYHTITKVTAVSQSTTNGNGQALAAARAIEKHWDERSARIERQAAHKVAVAFLTLEFQATGQAVTLERLFELTDAIANDVGNTAPNNVEESALARSAKANNQGNIDEREVEL